MGCERLQSMTSNLGEPEAFTTFVDSEENLGAKTLIGGVLR